MKTQKFVKYNSLNEKLTNKYDLKLNILENSANYLIHKDILRHQISQKQGTSSTKTRSEVSGGGRKPWQQKGTGRARAGSNRSPLWRGGGVIFGPKPGKIKSKLNKKEKKLALQTLLYNKRKSIKVIENFEQLVDKPSTKIIVNFFKEYNVDLTQKLLIIVYKKSFALNLSTRNLKNTELITTAKLNTFKLLKAKQIILTVTAFNQIKERYGN